MSTTLSAVDHVTVEQRVAKGCAALAKAVEDKQVVALEGI